MPLPRESGDLVWRKAGSARRPWYNPGCVLRALSSVSSSLTVWPALDSRERWAASRGLNDLRLMSPYFR